MTAAGARDVPGLILEPALEPALGPAAEVVPGPAPEGAAATALATAVSRAGLAAARALMASAARAHPEHARYVYLLDPPDGPAVAGDGFRTLAAADVFVPDPSTFFTQYGPAEAVAAVKPFVLEHLLDVVGHARAVWLEADTILYAPLDAALFALDEHDVVLLPRARHPPGDPRAPDDLAMLREGAYDSGFVALARGEGARAVLRWWQARLLRHCLDEPGLGLFLDQRWLDLVPTRFPGVHVLDDPAYGVAPWNVRERALTRRGDLTFAAGRPLVSFRFRGLAPGATGGLAPDPHGGGGDAASGDDASSDDASGDDPALRALRADHARALAAHASPGQSSLGQSSREAPPAYGHGRLPNGVEVVPLVREALNHALRRGRRPPDPWGEPDAFVAWLMTVADAPGGGRATPLQERVLARRPDVAAAHPGAGDDPFDPGFAAWMERHGRTEYGIGPILDRHPRPRADDPVGEVFAGLDAAGAEDVRAAHAGSWFDAEAFEALCGWVERDGADRFGWARAHGDRLRGARDGPARLLKFALGERDLRAMLPGVGEPDGLRALRAGIVARVVPRFASGDEVSLFAAFCRREPARVARAALLYGPAAEVRARPGARPGVQRGPARATRRPVVNVAGFLDAPSGMGESARSMLATAAGSSWRARALHLPSLRDEGLLRPGPAPFGWPSRRAALSVTVANADTTAFARAFCPSVHWAPRDVGYWVWETNPAPAALARAAVIYDAIWTPSGHSAALIAAALDAAALDRPVRVLPHRVDVDRLARVAPERAAFGFDEGVVVFAAYCDPASGLHRKNPGGAVRAFRRAFGDRRDVLLVLKVNGPRGDDLDDHRLRARIAGLSNVRLIEATWPRARLLALTASIDAYVSLHRAEGFGLTCAEAMALGKPVVATGYSGNLDFMDDACALLVPAILRIDGRAHAPYPAGSVWAEPDLDAAAAHMTALLDADLRARLGRRAREKIAATLGPGPVSRRFEALAREVIEGRSSRAPVAPPRPDPAPQEAARGAPGGAGAGRGGAGA